MQLVFHLTCRIFFVIKMTLWKARFSRRLASPCPKFKITRTSAFSAAPVTGTMQPSTNSNGKDDSQVLSFGVTPWQVHQLLQSWQAVGLTLCFVKAGNTLDQRKTLALIFEQEIFRVNGHSLPYWKYFLSSFQHAWPDSSAESDFCLYTFVLYVFQVTQNVLPWQAEISLALLEPVLLQLCRCMRHNLCPLYNG